MIRISTVASIFILLAGWGTGTSEARQAAFESAGAAYASDIPYPINSSAAGLVTLAIKVGSNGHVETVNTVRDIPSLTAPTLLAVNGWTFEPAMLDGRPISSEVPVEVLFNPGNAAFGKVPLVKIGSQAMYPNVEGYSPPQVISAVYGAYPPKTLLAGTVVLAVRIDKSGRVQSASSIFSTPTLSAPAITAVKKWRFMPALFKGRRVSGQAVVAFVFRSPAIPTPYGAG